MTDDEAIDVALEIGELIKGALPARHGFALVVFAEQGPLTFIRHGSREGVRRALAEFIAKEDREIH